MKQMTNYRLDKEALIQAMVLAESAPTDRERQLAGDLVEEIIRRIDNATPSVLTRGREKRCKR